MRLILTVSTLLSVLYQPNASAWGWDGHRLICAVATTQLTPAATAMVDQLLAEAGDLKEGVVNFADACVWPDDVKYSTRKSTYEHHFINVPDDATVIDLDRDCAATNCIAIGVQQSLSYLYREPNGKRDVTRRAAALRFLGHYIGDLHQPLHVANASDWGGNKIKVSWLGGDTNIHAVWDYKMMDTMKIAYPDSIEWLASQSPANTDGRVIDWMNQSLALGRSHGYVHVDGSLIKSGDRLGMDYLNRNKPVLIQRLLESSARLASLLNAIAAGERPVAFRLQAGAN